MLLTYSWVLWPTYSVLLVPCTLSVYDNSCEADDAAAVPGSLDSLRHLDGYQLLPPVLQPTPLSASHDGKAGATCMPGEEPEHRCRELAGPASERTVAVEGASSPSCRRWQRDETTVRQTYLSICPSYGSGPADLFMVILIHLWSSSASKLVDREKM